jgi:PAS domain S-box-containing protein
METGEGKRLMSAPNPATVVVVNDSPTQLRQLAGLLGKAGLHVLTFDGAREALQAMCRDGAPALIVTDLHMDEIDGWRFCRLLRSPEYPTLNRTPILVVSATYEGADFEQATTDSGANAFLKLPCDPEALRAVVQQLLSGQEGRRSGKVLVVEDDPLLCLALSGHFELRGHVAVGAASAEEGRAAFREHSPDLVVLDHHLPDAPGTALLREFREADRDVALVVITGDSSPELALEVIRHGADAYARKPFEFDYLYELCGKARRERRLLWAEELLGEREESERWFRERLTVLHEVSNALSTTASVDELCRRAVGLGRSRLGFGRLGIWFATENRDVLTGSFGTDESGGERDERNSRVKVTPGSVAERILSGSTRAVLDEDTPLFNDRNEIVGTGSQAVAALWDGHEITGFVSTDSLLSEEPLTQPHLQLLTLFATTLGHLCSHKRTEEALRESEERHRLLAENVSDVIWTMDLNLHHTYFSPSVQRMRGFSVEEAVAQMLEETVTPESYELAQTVLAEELALEAQGHGDPHRSRTVELELRCKDGSTLWTEITVTFLRDSAGRATGLLGVTRDLTERKRMQQQLEQQNRLAAVGQLAAGIAHDFNNLLTGVVGYAELLQLREDMPQDARSALSIIETQGHRAAALIRQILDFSRRSLLQPRPLDLASLVKETHKLLERTIPESIRVTLEIDPAEHVVNADVGSVQQVLTNLAVNARDAMPDGGEIRLRLCGVSLDKDRPSPVAGVPPGNWVLLAVSDQGLGMTAEVLEHCLEPFFTTKEVGAGTGLGLAQVYGIVKQHQGHLDVASELGKGTTVSVYLPALGSPRAEGDEEPGAETPLGNGETILLVEDEPQVRQTLQAALQALRYRAVVASNGREALQLYELHREEIAAVLTDMTMPEMGGKELLRTLRARDPDLRAIVLTGYAVQAEAEELLQEGHYEWLQKPPALPTLAQALRRAVSGTKDAQCH